MKPYFNYFVWTCIAALAFFSPGCIKDSPDDAACKRGIRVSFYSRTSCQPEITNYPDAGEMLLCVFDGNDILAAYRNLEGIRLNPDYSETIETGSGTYTVIAWTGIAPDRYDIHGLEVGKTRKNELLFRLKREQGQAYSLEGTQVYFGESPEVHVPEQGEKGERFVPVSVNLLEQTNRLSVSIRGLEGGIEDYEIDIESDNGSMNLDGSIAPDDVVKYAHTSTLEGGVLKTDFTLLKLELGYINTLIIKEKSTGKEIYRGSILRSLLLRNPHVNLNCDHDFNIDIVADSPYMIVEIWVNNWLVHSYGTDF